MNLKPVIALLILLTAGDAQSVRGVIGGVVEDPHSAPVPRVAITLINTETGSKRMAVTDTNGEFTMATLDPGAYRLEAEVNGFVKYAQAVNLEVNQDIRVSIKMAQNPTGTAEVKGEPVLLRTETSEMGGVIDSRQILGLPLDGRNFYELSLLLPGVAPAALGSAGSVRGAFSINVNGAREDANDFLLDGAYNGDPKLNGVGVTSPVDAIREFEVATSTYDTSFGRNAGGQISVVTRSGGNQIHSTLYEFYRPGALNADNFFAPRDQPAPDYSRNQAGAVIGGPLVKNRTFFFADFENTNLTAGQTLITSVPTALERAGNFNGSGLVAIDPSTGQPIQGNALPSYFIDPIGSKIANLFPLPNRAAAGGNFVSSPNETDFQNHFDLRFDHSIRPADTLFARYSFVNDSLFTPFAGSASDSSLPGYGLSVPSRAQNAAIGETHVFSPTLLNELRLGYNRVSNGDFQQNQGISINHQLGLPELSTNPRDWGMSLVTVAGFSPIGDENTSPEHGTTNTYQIADNATWVRGRHLVKFGTDIRILQENAYRDVEARGFIAFQGVYTGNPLEELLLGLPTDSGGATMNNPEHLRSHSFDFFANDTWRVKPNLTVTLGLRYEYNSPAVDAANRAQVYNPATGTLVPVGKNGFPAAGYDPQYRNFAPTLGVAWSPAGHGGTVVRAAYGIHYDQSSLAPGEGLYFSAPYFNLNIYFPIQNVFNLSLENVFPSFPGFLPASATAFQRNLATPYNQQWNFGIQQKLGASRVVEVGYVGSKGTHLIDSRNINQPQPSTNPQPISPNPAFADVDIIESAANSVYHSLQARLEQRLWQGLSMLASYTYSKSIDDASGFFATSTDPNFPQNSYNLSAERGRSDFDIRQRFTLSYAYDLPIAKGHRWLGGWQSFGVLTFQTGQPFTVALLPNDDNANTGQASLGFGANDRPNVAGTAKLANPSAPEWFNTKAFVIPPFGHFGNAGRNILDGPGLQTVDFSIVKNTAITERFTTQFRTEFFNLVNHTNFNLPDNFLGSSTFGQIVSARDPRRIQFGVKFFF